LQRVGGYWGYKSYAKRIEGQEARSRYSHLLDSLSSTINFILERRSSSNYPRNPSQFYALLALQGIELDRIADPWGNSYRVSFGIRSANYTATVSSSGPDERAGTLDDFDLLSHAKPFFESSYAAQVKEAYDWLKSYSGRYPRNAVELTDALVKRGAAYLSAKDAWGTPYQLRVVPSTYRSMYEVQVLSAGPDRKFNLSFYNDDLEVMRFERDWFAKDREAIDRAIRSRFAAAKKFPATESELYSLLKEKGIAVNDLRDPWGQPLKITFTQLSRYSERGRIESIAATPQSPAVSKTTVEPVTQTVLRMTMAVSAAPAVTGLDYPISFYVATYEQVIKEESRDDAAGVKPKILLIVNWKTDFPSSLAGIVAGAVVDPQGAVIQNASVTLTNTSTGAEVTTKTDEAGLYSFVNVPPGTYSFRAEAAGFMATIVQEVVVQLSTTTTVDITLQVGAASEMIMLASSEELPLTQRESSMVSEAKQLPQAMRTAPRPSAASTPRLRQDFPETLVWQPSLVTNADGKAEMKFNVADSITTWRLAVIGSTEDGMIGSTRADLRAFQPFFVEHQPPPSLTINDEIELPVVVRNFQQRASEVTVSLAPAPWMRVIEGASQPVSVKANDSATARILFKATSAGDFKQEASAVGTSDGDRVAMPVSVRFDGRDTWRTYADLFRGQTSFDISTPLDAIPGSAQLELKLYPNLFTHALEGIEGIVRRPYGCVEQTTSAGYANLLVLQYLKRAGCSLPAVERKALRNLAEAITRVRSFVSDGGYGYFRGSKPDLALTSYVLRFLTEAGDFAPVDETAIEATRRYLARAQKADGSWSPSYYSDYDLGPTARSRR
jgi:carboxypeptidase family protein/alpha-2-macroglobulin family protein/A-macroglobulin complement component